jgi:hypothetical protein
LSKTINIKTALECHVNLSIKPFFPVWLLYDTWQDGDDVFWHFLTEIALSDTLPNFKQLSTYEQP